MLLVDFQTNPSDAVSGWEVSKEDENYWFLNKQHKVRVAPLPFEYIDYVSDSTIKKRQFKFLTWEHDSWNNLICLHYGGTLDKLKGNNKKWCLYASPKGKTKTIQIRPLKKKSITANDIDEGFKFVYSNGRIQHYSYTDHRGRPLVLTFDEQHPDGASTHGMPVYLKAGVGFDYHVGTLSDDDKPVGEPTAITHQYTVTVEERTPFHTLSASTTEGWKKGEQTEADQWDK